MEESKQYDDGFISEAEKEEQLTLFQTAGRFGVKGAKYLFLVLILFSLVNILLYILSVVKLNDLNKASYLSFAIIFFILCGAFVMFALYQTYQYLLMDGLKTIYEKSTPFFKRLCSKIVGKVEFTASNRLNINRDYINNLFSKGEMLNELYGRKVPARIQKGLAFLVNKAPITDMLAEISDTLKEGDTQRATNMLYTKFDSYITDSVLGDNSMKWIYWLLPINIVVVVGLLYLVITFFS